MARQPIGSERVLEVLDVVLALPTRAERAIVDESRVEASERRYDEARVRAALAVLDLEHDIALARPRLQRRVAQPCEPPHEPLGGRVLLRGLGDQRCRELEQAL